MKLNYDLVVIGAGASGSMAAITARNLNRDISIAILESQESLGKKLRITGGGRCNFTNNEDIDDFFDMIVTNKKFLYSSLYNFTNEDMKTFIRKIGLDYNIEYENYNKVYLKSNNSQDFIEKIERILDDGKIDVFYNSKVEDIDFENREVYTRDMVFCAEKIIIATGGCSFPNTGSDGSMFSILSKNGYTIVPLKPALVPINVKNDWIRSMPGISFGDVEITVYQLNKSKYKKKKTLRGDIIFTHKGIGGPVTLKALSYINDDLSRYKISLDLLPNIGKEDFYGICRKNYKKTVFSNLKEILPVNFLKNIIAEYELKENNDRLSTEASGNISKQEIENLLSYIKDINLEISGLGSIEIGTVTSGGVDVKNINPNTLESKIHTNIFFSGEVIDVDALTGGYNLQIAFSTGVLAGQCII